MMCTSLSDSTRTTAPFSFGDRFPTASPKDFKPHASDFVASATTSKPLATLATELLYSFLSKSAAAAENLSNAGAKAAWQGFTLPAVTLTTRRIPSNNLHSLLSWHPPLTAVHSSNRFPNASDTLLGSSDRMALAKASRSLRKSLASTRICLGVYLA